MDVSTMEDGIRRFLQGIAERFDGDDLEATPSRVARAWSEDLLSGYRLDPDEELSWTPAPPGSPWVVVREVSFVSICVHHLLPFHGVAHLVYAPDSRLAGLSKLGRVVDAHARRLQIQERLTAEILSTVVRVLKPRGALIVVEAEHSCMTLRGVRKERSRLLTSSGAGIFESNADARREALDLVRPRYES